MRGSDLEKNVSTKLTRHTLRNWEKFLPKERQRKKGSDEYSPEQVGFLVKMLQATLLEDMSPAAAAKRVESSWFNREKKNISGLLEGMARVGRELVSKDSSELMLALLREHTAIPANALQRRVSLDRFTCMVRMLIGAEECGIFMPDRGGLQDLILVADAKDAGEPTQLGYRIRNFPGSDLAVARAARTQARLDLLAVEDSGGADPAFRSVLAFPLVDRKKTLRAVIQVEGKNPPAELKVGAFTDHDERIITAVAASLMPLLELQRMLVRGMDLVHRINSPSPAMGIWTFRSFAKDIVKAALTLAAADHCEVSIWDAERGLVFQAADEGNKVAVGQTLTADTPSVTYWVYWHCEPLACEDVNSPSMPVRHLVCNRGMRSEIAVPLRTPSSTFRETPPACFGVLNVESSKLGGEGGLDKEDLPMLSSLATIASVAFQLAEFKSCLGRSLAPKQMRSIIERVKGIAVEESERQFDAALYLVDYSEGCLTLREPAGVDVPPLSFEDQKTKVLAALVIEENKALFSVRPETDPRVWSAGLERFGIRGSLMAIPLMFRTGLGRTVVAVISLWNVTESAEPERLSEMQAKGIIQRCERELVLELGLK